LEIKSRAAIRPVISIDNRSSVVRRRATAESLFKLRLFTGSMILSYI